MPACSGSPVDIYVRRIGPTPYHICYKSEDIGADIEYLQRYGFKALIPLAPAAAFGGRRVVFMCSLELGMIEVVEEPADM